MNQSGSIDFSPGAMAAKVLDTGSSKSHRKKTKDLSKRRLGVENLYLLEVNYILYFLLV